MTNSTRVVTGVALGMTALVTAACASNAPPRVEAEGAAASCQGQLYLDVTNSFSTTVEVYGYSAAGGSRRYLGSVGPGSQRLPLTEPIGYVWAESGGERVSGRRASRGVPGSIAFSRGCAPRA